MKQPIKMTPGDELHLTALMAPFSLNLVTGQDRQHLLGYGRAAFEAGKAGQCLHQIQEPAAAEQAAWHAGLDEGRAQAAPSVMAVPDGWKLVPVKPTKEMLLAAGFSASAHGQGTTGLEKWEAFLNNAPTPPSQARAALADTPAAEVDAPVLADDMKQELMALYNEIMKQGRGMHYWNYAAAVLARYRGTLAAPLAAAPVVLPEPDFHVRPASAVQPHRALMIWDNDATSEPAYFARTVRALLATATGLPAQAVYAIDPVQAAADAASVGHLSHLVDHQTVLLSRAMSVMKAVELTASPIDESDGDLDARIPYEAWSTFVEARAALLHAVAQSPVAAPQAQADARDAEQPRLTVRLTSFPESNGKRNWTAMFKRTEKFDGLIGNAGGITIARGECWNRVAYHAEEARFLLGERGTEPDIMAYGDDVHTPQEWSGEDADGVFAAIAAAKGE